MKEIFDPELVSEGPARHVEYTPGPFGEKLDVRVKYPHALSLDCYFKFLKRLDRIPATIIFGTILSRELRGYLTGDAVIAPFGPSAGSTEYRHLDILAVGDEERAREFACWLRGLRTCRDRMLSYGGYSRVFEIRSAGKDVEPCSVVSPNAIGNFTLFAESSLFRGDSSNMKLCVLTNEAYEELQRPVEERQAT